MSFFLFELQNKTKKSKNSIKILFIYCEKLVRLSSSTCDQSYMGIFLTIDDFNASYYYLLLPNESILNSAQ